MFYKIVNRNDPKSGEKSPKFYCAPKSMGVVSLYDVAKEIEYRSSLTAGDVMNVLENFIDIAADRAKDGYSIQAGRLGTFVPTFKSFGVEKEEDCSARMIHSVRLSFRASESLRKILSEAHFTKL